MSAGTLCHGCGEPIIRSANAPEWQDLTLAEHHAGCRPGAGRIPYRPPVARVAAETRVHTCPTGHVQEPQVCRDVLVCRHGEPVAGRRTPAWACEGHAGLCCGCWRWRRAGLGASGNRA